jgi:hypothetical protein
MIVVIALTLLYQLLLNKLFAPLFRYLPITFEDEPVLRDEAFQQAQQPTRPRPAPASPCLMPCLAVLLLLSSLRRQKGLAGTFWLSSLK